MQIDADCLSGSHGLPRRGFLKDCVMVAAGAAASTFPTPVCSPAKTVPFDSVHWLPLREELLAMEPDLSLCSAIQRIEWAYHLKEFGEELARVNLLLATEPRTAYVWRMMGEMEIKGIPLSHSRDREWQDELERQVEQEFAEGKI